jgi:bifunctional non-homologous end joining protein LigD
MKNAEGNAWLLIKHRDEYSVKEPYDSEKLTPAASPINRWLKKHDQSAVRARPAAKKTQRRRAVRKSVRAKKKV